MAVQRSPKPSSEDGFEIEILAALPTHTDRAFLFIRHGSTARAVVRKAVESGGLHLDERFGALDVVPLGVYGELVDDDYVLLPDDRLELYRPLQQDPKVRRRNVALEAAQKRDRP